MSKNQTVTIHAPAKINLGLEILSRRDDGYHELRSVLSMVDLSDELHFTMRPDFEISHIDGVPGVSPSDNLIMRAISLFNERAGKDVPMYVRAFKRIPAPAGLGSASSNAAATLVALNHLHNSPLERSDLVRLAAELGSDVPFFLGSSTAAASGTGTTLTPLPDPSGWTVIVVPQIDLIAKTAKLYGMITPDDYTDGTLVENVVKNLSAGSTLPPDALFNAFSRPLRKLMPYVGKINRVMREAGCSHVALSGAGPAHYSIFPNEREAREVRQRLQPLLGPHDYVVVAAFRHSPLDVDAG